jgi:hypothetical protein
MKSGYETVRDHINPYPVGMQACENKTLHILDKTIDDESLAFF